MLLQTADSGYNRNYRVPGTVHNYKCRLGPINMGVWQIYKAILADILSNSHTQHHSGILKVIQWPGPLIYVCTFS